MILTFDKAGVKELLAHAYSSRLHRPCSADEPGDPVKPALHLVGDDGIYLMSNGMPHLPRPGKPEQHAIVYANECNPEIMAFDDWWNAKSESFGGDDGVEKIEGHDAQNWLDMSPGEVVRMKIGPDRLELLVDPPTP
jgi:hypothetical protein